LEVKISLPQRRTIEKMIIPENETVGSVIKKLGYDPDTIVVLFKNRPIPETTEITEDIELTVLEITSKG
jgi:sulfur carrier protein ThiS